MSSGAATSLCVRRQESVRSLLFAHGKRESVCYIETWIARRHFGPSARSGTICTVATSQMHAPSKKAKAIAPPEDEPDAKQPFQGSAEDAAAAIVGAASKITTSAKAAATGEGAIERTAITRPPHAHDRLHGAQVKSAKLLMDYGKLSPDERRAEALARSAEHGHLVDPSTATCTADEWLPSLLLPDGRTIVYHVDPSATTTDLIAEAARLMQRPAADIRLLDRDGDRLGTAGGVHSRVTRAASGTVPRRPVGVALARTGRAKHVATGCREG
jgi:hypothetical protein